MKCKKCGSELRENSLFCAKCGEKVEKREDSISSKSINGMNQKLKIAIVFVSILVVIAIIAVIVMIVQGKERSKLVTENTTEYISENMIEDTEVATEAKKSEIETKSKKTTTKQKKNTSTNTSATTESYKPEDYSTVYWPTQIAHIKEVYKYTVDNQNDYRKTGSSNEQYFELTQGNVVKAVIKNNQELNKAFGGSAVVEYYYENPDYDGKTSSLLFALVNVDKSMEYRYYFSGNYIIRYIRGKVGAQQQYDFEYETPESCPVAKATQVVYQIGKNTYYENDIDMQDISYNYETDPSTWNMKEDIQYIRNVYAYTNNNLNEYEEFHATEDIIDYIPEYRVLAKAVIKNDTELDEIFGGSTVVEYYYDNPFYEGNTTKEKGLIFAFVTVDKKEEYRYYFKEGRVIRYIGPDHVEHDFIGGAELENAPGLGISEVHSRGAIEGHWTFT